MGKSVALLGSYWGNGTGNADVMKITAQSTDPAVAKAGANAIAKAYIAMRQGLATETQVGIATHMTNEVSKLRKQLNAVNRKIVERKTKVLSKLSVNDQGNTHEVALADRTTATSLTDDEPFQQLLADRESLLKLQVEFEQRAEQIRIDASVKSGGPLVVSKAVLPTAPIGPGRIRRAMTATIIGLVLGMAAALISGLRDPRVRVPGDLRLAGAPAPLAFIPSWVVPLSAVLRRKSRLAARSRTVASTVRTLAACLLGDTRPFVVGVTGLRGGEGVSSVVAGLARAYAQAGRSVVVVDAHLPTHQMSRLFDAPHAPGLRETLAGTAGIDDALHATNTEGVWLMPGGDAQDSWDLVASPQSGVVVHGLAMRFDVVLFDLPPVLQSAAASTIARHLNAGVLLAASGWTKRADIRDALHVFEPPELISVLNCAPRPGFSWKGFSVKMPFGGRGSKRSVAVPLVGTADTRRLSGLTVGEALEGNAA